jgi:hypothetical protein
MDALTLEQATRVALILREELNAELDPAVLEAAGASGVPFHFFATAPFFSFEEGEATAQFTYIPSFSDLRGPCITGAQNAFKTFQSVLRCRRANQRLQEIALELACSRPLHLGPRARMSALAG